jgi:hypothetical protein
LWTERKKYIMKRTKLFSILIPVAIFILVSIIYFLPIIEGKVLQQSDIIHNIGVSKELKDFRAETGHEALWSNSIFGGMPGYLHNVQFKGNLIAKVISYYYAIPHPINVTIIYFSMAFVLLLLLGVNSWISFAGAMAYGLTTFFYIVIGAGHNTKALTLAFVALLVGGVIYAYNKDKIKGSIIASIGLSWMLTANHLQITYYAGLMTVLIVVAYFISALKEKALPSFLKTSALLLVAVVFAVGTNFSNLYTTYEYGKYSTRSKSELTIQNLDDKTSGLDKSYIFDYSYDLGEAVTAFIPRFKGGGMAEKLPENSAVYTYLSKVQGKEQARKITQSFPTYWGSQPISNAPFYFGAVLCFLFVLGLFIVKGKDKWWLVATVIVAFILSLGEKVSLFAWISHLMVDYFPGYNKFRDVKNIIVIQEFAMALLGALAVKEIYARNIDDKKFLKGLKYAFLITGGFALLFAILPGLAGNFTSENDARYISSGWPQELIEALRSDRKLLLRMDAFRSFVFVTLAAGVIWAFWKKKLRAQYALVLWVILILADMWPVNKRYLNDSHFVNKRKMEVPFTPSKADQEILKDKDPNYRVLNISVNPWSDASTSYFHKSIGGYHGAKMKRYQELIENHLSPEIQTISTRLRDIKSQDDLEAVFSGLNTLNMLNTRYMIYNPEAAPLMNTHALGNAWLVKQYQLVKNANEEIDILNQVEIESVAIIDQQFKSLLPDRVNADSTASISLTSYAPNKLVYQTKANSDQLAVFSEIYYPKGWVAKVDGVETPVFRANYILRAMMIPQGEHEVVFEFKPRSYYIGNKISLVSSLLLLLAIAVMVFVDIKKRKKQIDA